MRHVTSLLLVLLVAGCFRPLSDPDQVSSQFADALLDSRPGSAMMYVNPIERTNPAYLRGLEVDANRLADCKGKVVRTSTKIVDDRTRFYWYVFGALCGKEGISFSELYVRVEQIDGRWAVTEYSPQIWFTN